MGRFINADGQIDGGAGFIGCNLFAYCGNNPVMYSDPSGEFIFAAIIIGAAIGAIAGGIYGNHKANEAGATGWKKVGYIVGWGAGGAVVGGTLGWGGGTVAGIGGISITMKGGITLIPITLLGQNHHVLTNPLMRALNNHVLKGLFQRAGSVVQALYKYSHYGYQAWHRAIDNYMVRWLQNNPNATSKQFWLELYNQYNTKEMIKRFGEGVLNYIKKQLK